jgi:hypothetical protein
MPGSAQQPKIARLAHAEGAVRASAVAVTTCGPGTVARWLAGARWPRCGGSAGGSMREGRRPRSSPRSGATTR